MSQHAIRTEIRTLLNLAWPVMLAHVQWLALNLIDTIMVGRFSTIELSYLASGRILTWTVLTICIGFMFGVTVLVARAHGAGTLTQCGAILRQGIVYGGVLGIGAILFLSVLSTPILHMLGVPPAMVAGGAAFVQIMVLSFAPNLVTTAGNYFLEGISRPRPVMVISLSTLPLNMLLNWLFIYGNAGLPAMGARGAALGTVLSVLVGMVATLVYIWRMRDGQVYGIGETWRGAWRSAKELRRFGLAPGIASGFEIGGFSILSAYGASLGSVTAAAFQAVVSLHIASLAITLGMASAAAVRVGNAVGAREKGAIARRGWLASFFAMGSVAVVAGFYLAFPEAMLRPFTNDPDMLALGVKMLLVLAPFLLFDGGQITLLFALRAAGDQVVAGAVQITSFFLVMTGSGWWFVHKTSLGALGLPLALGLGCLVAWALMAARFTSVSKNPPALRGSSQASSATLTG